MILFFLKCTSYPCILPTLWVWTELYLPLLTLFLPLIKKINFAIPILNNVKFLCILIPVLNEPIAPPPRYCTSNLGYSDSGNRNPLFGVGVIGVLHKTLQMFERSFLGKAGNGFPSMMFSCSMHQNTGLCPGRCFCLCVLLLFWIDESIRRL